MNHLTTETFDANARAALTDLQLRGALRQATSLFGKRRLAAAQSLPDWEDLRTLGMRKRRAPGFIGPATLPKQTKSSSDLRANARRDWSSRARA